MAPRLLIGEDMNDRIVPTATLKQVQPVNSLQRRQTHADRRSVQFRHAVICLIVTLPDAIVCSAVRWFNVEDEVFNKLDRVQRVDNF